MEVVPSPRRLVDSLRDVGYDLPTAIADLVDNSIEAQATEVRIDVVFDGSNSWIRIADNGLGMDETTLDEALRYGSDRTYREGDLGRFGLGLKVASLSQCRRLTVASRQDGAELGIRCWDLDHLYKTNRWELLKLPCSDCRKEVIEPLASAPGTVVMWERLDRALSHKDPLSGFACSGMARLCRDTEDYLAMVFHRFVEGTSGRGLPLRLYVNSNLVEPWDPFARQEPRTRALRRETIRFDVDGTLCTVGISPYILPTENQFSSPMAHARASGPKKWNNQQGFYVYRSGRMIQSGGWNGLRTVDEHTKLARVALDFSSRLDSAFKVNVAKMTVRLPHEGQKELQKVVASVSATANAAYRQRREAPAPEKPTQSRPPFADSVPRGVPEPPGGQEASVGRVGGTPGVSGRARTASDASPSGSASLVLKIVRVLVRELGSNPGLLERVRLALLGEVEEFSSVTWRA